MDPFPSRNTRRLDGKSPQRLRGYSQDRRLPVAVATPDPSKPGDRGDIVAYSVKGLDAGAVARQLASADGRRSRAFSQPRQNRSRRG